MRRRWRRSKGWAVPDLQPDPLDELVRIKRLGQEVSNAGLECPQTFLGVRMRREHHDRNRLCRDVGLEPLNGFPPVHHGHDPVQQHDIRSAQADFGTGQRAVLHGVHGKRRARQDAAPGLGRSCSRCPDALRSAGERRGRGRESMHGVPFFS
jgi:hypothetical protein